MKNFKNDLKIGGIINIIIYISGLLLSQYYLKTKTSAFDGFKHIHHIVWYSMLILQNVYLIHTLFYSNKETYMNKAIYNFFTVGGLKSYKDILIASEVEPLFEYCILFIFIMIPWPVLKNVTFKKRMLLIFAKIGIFHFVTSLFLINWKTKIVNYNTEFFIVESTNEQGSRSG